MHACSFPGVAGVVAKSEYLDNGLIFSWPTYKSGLSVMIHTHLQTGSTWAFATPFHWSVWVALGGTTVIVGLLVGLTERLHKGVKANPKGMGCLLRQLAVCVRNAPSTSTGISVLSFPTKQQNEQADTVHYLELAPENKDLLIYMQSMCAFFVLQGIKEVWLQSLPCSSGNPWDAYNGVVLG